jgi:large repetitive protein
VRKTTATLFTGVTVAILVGAAIPGAAFAKAAPLVQECSADTNGGSLVNGVCDMPSAIVGSDDYFGYIEANNDAAADRFTIVSGKLPPGLTMPTNLGQGSTFIQGEPTQVGTFRFVIHAADPNNGLSSNQTYSLPTDMLLCSDTTNGGTVTGGECVLPDAAVGQQYDEPFALSDTGGGITVTGTFPPGMSASGGVVIGTPTQQGTFLFTVTEIAQVGSPIEQTYGIDIGPPFPLIDTTENFPPGLGTVGTVYEADFTVSGGEAPYTWSRVTGQLPPGLALASPDTQAQTDSELAGTPTTAGTYVFTMQVTDTLGDTASGQVSITIDPRPPLKISGTGACCSAGTVDVTYPYVAFGATGGESPYTWTVATGQVPPGLSFSAPNLYEKHAHPGAGIILAGIPTTAGSFNFTMEVTDSLGDTDTEPISITITA